MFLSAHVTPTNAIGTVQFKDGTTVIASAPVITGIGTAISTFAILPAGPHSITAMFVPRNNAAFRPSTSAPPVTFKF